MHLYKACKLIFHIYSINTFRLEFLKRGKFFATFATKIGKIRKNRRATRLKRAKKVDMHFYQRVIIHYTHTFFSGRLFPIPLPLSLSNHLLSLSMLLFYALNHQQQQHRMCCIYRIRHDPAPSPFPFPICPTPCAIPSPCFPSTAPLILLLPCALSLEAEKGRGMEQLVS